MKANGNFSNTSLERFYSVRINRMSPSGAVDLGRPCNSFFEFQVVHRYVFIWCVAVLNIIRFPDRDPTGFCDSEPDPDRTGFRKNSTGSDLDIQTALITAVKYLIRTFFRI